MQKKYVALGLMSGTSGDGVDASIVETDGINEYQAIKDKYFEYDSAIYKNIHSLKAKIENIHDLEKFSKELRDLERKITIFHSKAVKDLNVTDKTIIGFHGQTIYHNSKEKISNQLGDGHLLQQLTNKKIVFNFRKNDILNGGEGAPLTPIFHKLIVIQKKIKLPVCILNIGGISNATIIKKANEFQDIFSKDIGPGNCLVDNWLRNNSTKKFDQDGEIALRGQINEIIIEQAQSLYENRVDKKKLSFDTKDFDISFVRGLSLEDGSATLTDFTSSIISNELISFFESTKVKVENLLVCGGGRKNPVLIASIREKLPKKISIKLIDDYNLSGDFIESQAFGYLAIRSILNLPLSYPNTTGCRKACSGGELLEI